MNLCRGKKVVREPIRVNLHPSSYGLVKISTPATPTVPFQNLGEGLGLISEYMRGIPLCHSNQLKV